MPQSNPLRLLALGLCALLVSATCNSPAEPVPPPDEAAGSTKQNIILILTDDQTMTSLQKMPFLLSKPEGSWINFRNAFLSTPLCCPSRASLLTGRYSFKSGVITNDAGDFEDKETLPVWLRRAGYRTGLVGKYMNFFLTGKDPAFIPRGWDKWVGVAGNETGGFYYDYQLNIDGDISHFGNEPEDYSTDVLTEYAQDFISSSQKPFFLWLSYRAPHRPRVAAVRHRGMFQNWKPRLDRSFNEANVSDKPRWVRKLPRVSAGSVRRDLRYEARAAKPVDEGIEALMQTLEDEGKLDDTVLIFMTDNGVSMGEHRYLGEHGQKQCPYEACIRTPLFIRYPGAENGRVGKLVSNIDIAPTIQSIAGATSPFNQDGRSLIRLLKGRPTEWRNHVLIDWRSKGEHVPPYKAVRTKRWKYVWYRNGDRELYDRKNDPYELRSLHRNPDYQHVMARLDRKLAPLR